MKSKLACALSAVSLLVLELQPRPADACGVKLVIKAPNPRRAVARSSRPSTILVVGKRLAEGNVELRDRASGDSQDVPVDQIVARIADLVG